MESSSDPREKGLSVSDQNIPDQLRYTDEHEWVERVSDTRVRIGITEYAQSKLGDIVFVQLPDIGSAMESGESFGEVESPKSVSDLYAPLTGKIVESNSALETSPELVNTDPYGEGWIVVVEVSDVEDLEAQLEQTLDSDGYAKITDS